MKKLINQVENILREALDGFGMAHADLVRISHDPHLRRARDAEAAPARWR